MQDFHFSLPKQCGLSFTANKHTHTFLKPSRRHGLSRSAFVDSHKLASLLNAFNMWLMTPELELLCDYPDMDVG